MERSSGRLGETIQRTIKTGRDLEEFRKQGENLSYSLGESGERMGTTSQEFRNVIADVSEKTAGVREQLQRERNAIEGSKQGIRQRIGESIAGMRDKLEYSIREHLKELGKNIRGVVDQYNSFVKERDATKTAEQSSNGLEKSSTKSVNTENRSDDTMSAMSRFNQIEAERKQKIAEKEAREKPGMKEDKPADSSPEEKPSIMDKLNKWEKEKKENRTEPLKSEQKQNEEQTIHRKPHNHR